ncbi:hypothetical protein PHIN3_303 [Sinorhizobium phage phiN3]|uniref:Uncharacterized protein n=1 Tax=Sinorhizobium phage phiN3 TaxID=1647405 RepID=A0A0F6YQ79_9CAUD|nr:hypothetical protein AVT40_gp230 [Sinorhizobium phage phiN3]AKF13566.1 hypothetical protein PHIN3_303 [Sinorhizobium phage phiN3]
MATAWTVNIARVFCSKRDAMAAVEALAIRGEEN